MTGGDGSLWKTTAVPDPTGKLPDGHTWQTGAATVQTTCWSSGNVSKEGVFIGENGDGRVFYIDWTLQQYFEAACDGNGVVKGGANRVFSATAPKTGDILALCIEAQPSGMFNVAYSINGKVAGTESVALPGLTTDPSMNSGFWGIGGALFDDAFLNCGLSCAAAAACSNCAGDLAQCWSLEVEGIFFNPSTT
ncbi:MAG TPA: hypothetical protein VGP63_29455, partial [Planctomycetaceae bacterium]|nr:hypothetical protein [Planctomycetaceae bacterium]